MNTVPQGGKTTVILNTKPTLNLWITRLSDFFQIEKSSRCVEGFGCDRNKQATPDRCAVWAPPDLKKDSRPGLAGNQTPQKSAFEIRPTSKGTGHSNRS